MPDAGQDRGCGAAVRTERLFPAAQKLSGEPELYRGAGCWADGVPDERRRTGTYHTEKASRCEEAPEGKAVQTDRNRTYITYFKKKVKCQFAREKREKW